MGRGAWKGVVYNSIGRFLTFAVQLGDIGMQVYSWLRDFLEAPFHQWMTRVVCWFLFLFPLTVYTLIGRHDWVDRPQVLDVGVVTVSAALGGLVLNAGVRLTCAKKKKETVYVALKFIAVVILMTIFLPSLYIVELIDDFRANSPELNSVEAWGSGFFFWIAGISFYGGISFFIIALVDLVFVMVGIVDTKNSCGRKHGDADSECRCEAKPG